MVELWMPILLSAVFVFLVSSVIHMVLPIHRKDYGRLPDEAGAMEALRNTGLQPGDYVAPCPDDFKDLQKPEVQEAYAAGPVLFMTVLPNGVPNMGKALLHWFLYCIVVSIFAGYVATLAHGPGADYMAVFRAAGTAAIMVYATANVTNSIWKGQSWGTTFKFVFDGIAYGLVTAGTFAWLWPEAV